VPLLYVPGNHDPGLEPPDATWMPLRAIAPAGPGPEGCVNIDGRLVEVREAKVRALLADLLLSLGRTVPADRLIDDLWGADLPVHPAGALQLKVSRLRQALENAEPGGGELVAFRSPGYEQEPRPWSQRVLRRRSRARGSGAARSPQ